MKNTIVAKSLLPKAIERPRCMAYRETAYSCDNPGTSYQCVNRASVEIEGQNLCRRHAASVLMDLVMSGEYVLVKSDG